MCNIDAIKNDSRTTFVFKLEWIVPIKLLPKKDQLPVFYAIAQYAKDGTIMPGLSKKAMEYLESIIPTIDCFNDKFYAKIEKRKEAGRLGGLAKSRNQKAAAKRKERRAVERAAAKARETLSDESAKSDDFDMIEKSDQNPLQATVDEYVVANPSCDEAEAEAEAEAEVENEVELRERENERAATAALTATAAQSASADKLSLKREKIWRLLTSYIEKYGEQMVKNFFNYWTETTPDNTKMRFELQKTWDWGRRLEKWSSNERQNQTGGAARSPSTPGMKTTAELYAESDAYHRECEERAKHAITREEFERQKALEDQGYALDEDGNILGVRKELEAKGWRFSQWGEILFRPSN